MKAARLLVIFAALICSISPVLAQSDNRVLDAWIARAQHTEDALLTQRRQLLKEESSFANPIWVEDSNGNTSVIDGDALRERIAAAVFVADAIGLADAAIATRPWYEQAAAMLVNTDVHDGVAINKVMDGYKKNSDQVRRRTLRSIDDKIEFVRAQFAHVIAVRDGEGSEPVRAGLAAKCLILQDNPDAWTAKWYWSSSSGVGPIGFEVDGIICGGDDKGFSRFTGSSFEKFACEADYTVNCTPVSTVNVIRTENNKGGSITYFYDGPGWNPRGRRELR